MKKVIVLCTAAALCLSLLSGCGGGNPTQSEAPSSPAVESENVQATPTPAPASPEASEEVQPTPGGLAVDLAAFAQTVQQNHEFYSLERADPEDAEMGAVMLGNWYPGLTDLDLEQVEIYTAMVSFSGGELALVQAKNAGDADKVKEIFQARLDSKTTDGPGNYPEEVEMWQRSAKVAVNGNYVLLVNHEDSEAIVSEFNALFA